MQIKYSALAGQLKKNLPPLVIITGRDPYLQNDAAQMIIKAKETLTPTEKLLFHLNNSQDWLAIMEEVLQPSLFHQAIIFDIRFDKTTLDAEGKKQLPRFLDNPPKDTLLLIRAPQLSIKALGSLANHPQTLCLTLYPLQEMEMIAWIDNRLRALPHPLPTGSARHIYQFTQNNLLAAQQVIDKLSLCPPPNTLLALEQHLMLQCDFELYEIKEALLKGDLKKIILILSQAEAEKTEAPIVLWQLSDAIRQLIELHHLSQSMPLPKAAQTLGIWTQRVPLYQQALKRLSYQHLAEALCECQSIDEQIKSNNHPFIWQALTLLASRCCYPMETHHG